jgi:hypothetical protein
VTNFSYFATDVAGNSETPKAEMVLVGGAEGIAASCASTPIDVSRIPPTGTVPMGSFTVFGISYPFNVTFSY